VSHFAMKEGGAVVVPLQGRSCQKPGPARKIAVLFVKVGKRKDRGLWRHSLSEAAKREKKIRIEVKGFRP